MEVREPHLPDQSLPLSWKFQYAEDRRGFNFIQVALTNRYSLTSRFSWILKVESELINKSSGRLCQLVLAYLRLDPINNFRFSWEISVVVPGNRHWPVIVDLYRGTDETQIRFSQGDAADTCFEMSFNHRKFYIRDISAIYIYPDQIATLIK